MLENNSLLVPLKKYNDGEPCNHAGCLNHVFSPCEGCGRIAGRQPTNAVPRWINRKNGYTYIVIRNGMDCTNNRLTPVVIYYAEHDPDQWYTRTVDEFLIKFERLP